MNIKLNLIELYCDLSIVYYELVDKNYIEEEKVERIGKQLDIVWKLMSFKERQETEKILKDHI